MTNKRQQILAPAQPGFSDPASGAMNHRLSLLYANGYSITYGQNRSKRVFGVIHQPVELENGTCTFIGIRFRHLAAPQDVVRYEQAATLQMGERDAKYARVIGFVDVIEDDVVGLLLF